MDRSAIAYLISDENLQNPDGTWKANQSRRKVFVNISSVTGNEWFNGARTGINPELRITMFGPDYHGEQIIETSGKIYTIYRTYMSRNDEIELYCERRMGTA